MFDRRLFLAATIITALVFRIGGAAAQASRAPRVTAIFAVRGGQSTPSPVGHPAFFAEAVMDIDLARVAPAPLGVTAFELLDDTGRAVASMSAVEYVVRIPSLPPVGDQWAPYMTPEGSAITGPLPAGMTRVRIRVRLDRSPGVWTPGFRLVLSGLGAPMTVTGLLRGEWGT